MTFKVTTGKGTKASKRPATAADVRRHNSTRIMQLPV